MNVRSDVQTLMLANVYMLQKKHFSIMGQCVILGDLRNKEAKPLE